MTINTTPRYWVRSGLFGKAIGVTRLTDEGQAQAWAWGRWVDIPHMPDPTDTMVDEIDEATALRIVADPELFEEGDLPDPEASATSR